MRKDGIYILTIRLKSFCSLITAFGLVITSEMLSAQVDIGQLVPDFEYNDLAGTAHKLSDYPFCRAEAPSTEANIWQEYKDNLFQALALDTWDGTPAQAQSYADVTGITYPVLTKASSALSLFGMTYDNYVVIDHQGVLRYSSAGNGILGERYRLSDIQDVIEEYLAKTGLNPGEVPLKFELSQNYPNPFNASTLINYSILNRSHVLLQVFDVRGRLISTIVNAIQPPSEYEVEWNPTAVPTGIYIYRIMTDGIVITRKMLYIK